jgi:hypothetical protein
MKPTASLSSLIGLAALTAPGMAQQPPTPREPMSFFVTSVGLGDGGKLGGLPGADAHCQKLAGAAGRGSATWRAYLSQAAGAGLPQVHARDRIGRGPWYNAAGVVIAWSLEDLHEDRNNIRKYTAIDEKGAEVKGRGDDVNHHDILTGSDSTGRLIPGDGAFTTCGNWTSNKEGRTMVGHHDRLGGANASWNSVHSTRGCSQEDLIGTGGVGLFYCFAVN